ncbi:hypothetical protein ACQY0O_008108 [Thecaphora frezii]
MPPTSTSSGVRRRKRTRAHRALAGYASSDANDDADADDAFGSPAPTTAAATAAAAARRSATDNATDNATGSDTAHRHAPGDLFSAHHFQLKPVHDAIDAVLLPRAYELTLNHHHDLRKLLHYHPQLLHHRAQPPHHHPSASHSHSPATHTDAAAASLRLAPGDAANFSSDYTSGPQTPAATTTTRPRPAPSLTKLVPYSPHDATGTMQTIWTDRFDAVHLLPSLPSKPPRTQPISPSSDSEEGWSDLPSDSEDLFFLTSSEAADFLRQKKRNRLEDERQKRMAAILALEQSSSLAPTSLEEETTSGFPEEAQYALMQRTAKVLVQSTNPALLEMRILANHGSDPRFAFLRSGEQQRWGEVWRRIKSRQGCETPYEEMKRAVERQDDGETQKVEGNKAGLLVAYGSDSDSEDQSGGDEAKIDEVTPSVAELKRGETQASADVVGATTQTDTQKDTNDDDETNRLKRKQRLERAKEWAKKRREEKEAAATAAAAAASEQAT